MTVERLAVYSAETRIITDIASFASATAISSTQAKTGTYSYTRNTNIGPTGKALVTPLSAVRTGFWLYLTTSVIQSTTYLYWSGMTKINSRSSSHLGVTFDLSGGNLQIIRPLDSFNDEVLAAVAIPSQFSTTATWFPIGITHKIAASDGFLSVYVSGSRVLHYEGDTRPSYVSSGQVFDTTTAYVLVAGAGGTSGLQGFQSAFVDDHYIDSYVGEADGPVPSRRFLASFPSAAGHDSAWTPDSGANYTNVDDNPHDGDATKVKALAADLRDTYVYTDITVPTDHRIVQVLPMPFAKRLDSALDNGLSVHAWDGAQYIDSPDIDLAMSYDIPVFSVLETQPDGSDWNQTDFNAMQFGIRSRGSF